MVRAGTLRHQVTIQADTLVQNAFNEWVHGWADVATVWGAIEPNNGSRFFEAMQSNSEVQGAVRIRYRSGIDASMRLLFGTRVYKIISVVNYNERNKELIIYYKEDID